MYVVSSRDTTKYDLRKVIDLIKKETEWNYMKWTRKAAKEEKNQKKQWTNTMNKKQL